MGVGWMGDGLGRLSGVLGWRGLLDGLIGGRIIVVGIVVIDFIGLYVVEGIIVIVCVVILRPIYFFGAYFSGFILDLHPPGGVLDSYLTNHHPTLFMRASQTNKPITKTIKLPLCIALLYSTHQQLLTSHP